MMSRSYCNMVTDIMQRHHITQARPLYPVCRQIILVKTPLNNLVIQFALSNLRHAKTEGGQAPKLLIFMIATFVQFYTWVVMITITIEIDIR